MPALPREALLIVDVQNDFCAGGALAVPDGDVVVPVINQLARAVSARGGIVLASRDWHPRQTTHFVTEGGVWPVHCVAGTPGAQFHPGLDLPPSAQVITKGDDPGADGYSAFEGHLPDGEAVADALHRHGVRRVIVTGLATDYCVKHSALEARRAGFDVAVVEDAVRGVNLQPDDASKALAEMKAAGAIVVASADILGP
jgi:nicotinamidase/pyrazinamidase